MNISWIAWLGSANDTKWVGFELDGLGWAGLIKMDPCPCLHCQYSPVLYHFQVIWHWGIPWP